MKSPLQILYLEDDHSDAELVQETLASEGILSQITRVETEADFRAALAAQEFDLILADFTLPTFDGLSALKIAQLDWPSLPLIFVSGTMGEEIAIETLKTGATDYVFKTRLSRIVPSIQRALREAEERHDLSRAQDALRRSEAYLLEAQKLSRTGSFGWDIGSGEIYWSEETFRIFEYDLAIKPSLELVLERTHPEDRGLVRQMIERVKDGRENFDFQHRLLLPSGSIKYLRVVGRQSNDDPVGCEFLGAVTDITERRRAEEALQKAQTELAHVTRVTALGELTASIAHEINQPLAGILTNASASLHWLAGDPPKLDDASEAIRRIVRDANRVSNVISRVRALFKKAPTTKEPLNVGDAVAEILFLTRSEIQRHGISLETKLGRDLPPVLGDKVQLQQVVLNLLINAIEAMSTVTDGLRNLSVSAQQVAAIPSESACSVESGNEPLPPKWILVSVKDSGPGVDPSAVDRLFEAFYTTKEQGLGMGLAISHSIVEAHGGRLWAAANAPRGAVFQFALPIESDTAV
jgi:signal transduction histidine kinase/CheY-like chemotaxis protein